MAKKIRFSGPCADNRVPRIGGGALIGNVENWPTAPDGIQLTLVLSVPAGFLNENAGFDFPEEKFVSVFTYYNPGEYFLDFITYHGSPEELEWLGKGYTKVVVHDAGDEVFGDTVVPMMAIEVDSLELDDSAPFQGSKIGGEPGLLQAEPLDLGDQRFALQVYGGAYPKPFQGIFGLSDAVGYLFVATGLDNPEKSGDAGTFFVQVT